MRFGYIHTPSANSSKCTHFPSHPTMYPVSLIKANLCCTNILKYVAFYWNIVDFSGATSQRKQVLPFPTAKNCPQLLSQGWDLVATSHLHGRIWCGLGSHRSCACWHTAVFVQLPHCVLKMLFLCSLPLPLTYIVSEFCSSSIPEPWEERVQLWVPFRVGHSTVSYSLHDGQLWVSVVLSFQVRKLKLRKVDFTSVTLGISHSARPEHHAGNWSDP